MGWFSDAWEFVRDDVIGTVGNAIGDMGIPIVSPIAGAVGDAFSDAADKREALAQHNKDLLWQSNEAQISRDFQLEMWSKSNEWNDPASQLSRLQSAGISPNALFSSGQGGYTSATASPTQGASATYGSSIAPSMLTSRAVNSNLLAQAHKTQTEADLNEYTLGWNKLTESERLRTIIKTNENLAVDIGVKEADIAYKKADISIRKQLADSVCRKNEQEIKEMNSRINLMRNQAIQAIAQARNLDAQTASEVFKRALLWRQTQLVAQQTKTEENRTELVGQQYKTEVKNTELVGEYIEESKTRQNVNSMQEFVLQGQGVLLDEQTEYQDILNTLKEYELGFSEATGLPYGIDAYNLGLYLDAVGGFVGYVSSLTRNFNHSISTNPGGFLLGVGSAGSAFGKLGSYSTTRPQMIVVPTSSVGYPMN